MQRHVQPVAGRKIRFASAGCGRIAQKHFAAIAQHGAQMATSRQDGLRMFGGCDLVNVCLFIVKQDRRNAALQLLKRAFERERCGSICIVAVNRFWARHWDFYDSAKWRGTWELDDGAFMNPASRYVVLLDWLVSPVESAWANICTMARDFEVEDSSVAGLCWRSGALGTRNVTMWTYPKNLEGSITIRGEIGTVRVGCIAANEVQQWALLDQGLDDNEIRQASGQATSVYGFRSPLYYGNGIKALRGEAELEADGADGLKSFELLSAMNWLARGGKRVAHRLER